MLLVRFWNLLNGRHVVEQSKPGEATLIVSTKIDPTWHLYSKFMLVMAVQSKLRSFQPDKNFTRVGVVTESEVVDTYTTKFFEMPMKYFENKAEFRQKLN
ncbi:MAG: hypothetical protein IPL74_19035 [Bacteroidetes bacterium]|nr:hypothetical protein [Bacteroidota bacterium]